MGITGIIYAAEESGDKASKSQKATPLGMFSELPQPLQQELLGYVPESGLDILSRASHGLNDIVQPVLNERLTNYWKSNRISSTVLMRAQEGYHSVFSLAFSPNGKLLASGRVYENSVRLWNVITGEQLPELQGHDGHVHSVLFSPDGKLLASASEDYSVRLWAIKTGFWRKVREKIWSVLTMGFSFYKKIELTADWAGPGAVLRAFSPDSNLLALGRLRGPEPTYVWNLYWGTIKGSYFDRFYPIEVAFSLDGRTLFGVSFDHWIIEAVDMKTGQSKEIKLKSGCRGDMPLARFSPNRKVLATIKEEKCQNPCTVTITFWDVATGEEIKRFEWDEYIESIAFSPDGRILAIGTDFGTDCCIILLNIATGQIINHIKTKDVAVLVFSPDGRTLASGGSSIRLWRVEE